MEMGSRKEKRKSKKVARKDARQAKKAAPSTKAAGKGYAEGAAEVKPKPATPVAGTKKVDFENLVVSASDVLIPEMGLSGLQRQQMEAGIAYIDSADEAFEFTDEGQFTVEKVVCPSTGERFERVTYYAGDTACGFIVDIGTANVRAMIEDGFVEPK